MKPIIETPRTIIREILPEDEQGMFVLDSNPEVHRYLGNHPIENIEQAQDIITFVRQQYVDNGIGRWAVIEKSTQQFMGWTGFKLMKTEMNKHINFFDIGYRFIQSYWGKGFAKETALACLNYGFETLQHTEVYGMADVQNIASNKVLSGIGLNLIETFEFEDTPHHWYHLTREQWQNKR